MSSDPVTVAYIVFSATHAGAEMVLLELVSGLDRSRFLPVVITLAGPAPLSQAFREANVEIHHLGMSHIVEAPLVLLKAVRLTRRIRPRLIHGVLFYGDVTARLLRMAGCTPHVVSWVHSTYVGKRWSELVMRHTDGLTDAVTAVSRAVARAQIEAGSIKAEKVSVIENGIDLARFVAPPESTLSALRQRFGITELDRVLLCVGRLVPEKNHALLLRVFAQLLGSIPNAKLLLVGGGELETQLRAQAADLGLGGQVVFAGPVAPVGPVFFLAESFVLASSLEGLPMVVLEAMAAGCPLVATAVGGIPEVIHDGRTGFVVPPNDEAALLAALLRMLHLSVDERAELARSARLEVARRFSMERMVERTQAVYDRVLAPHAPPSAAYLADLYLTAHQ